MTEHDHGDSHDHSHDGQDHDGHGDDGHQHQHLELDTVSFAVLTVSSSRTLETDEGGDRIQELILPTVAHILGHTLGR